MADALFFKDGDVPPMPEVREQLAPEYLRDPVEPFGYGHGRDDSNPNIGKWRYIRSNRPAGVLVVPNEEDSPNATHGAFEWQELPSKPGAYLGALKEQNDGNRSRKRS